MADNANEAGNSAREHAIDLFAEHVRTIDRNGNFTDRHVAAPNIVDAIIAAVKEDLAQEKKN